MKAIQTLQELITPAITALGYELWGCVMVSEGSRSVLRIYIDKEPSVNIDDCERASRQISAVLDVEDPMPGKYTLEVSSPGMDRPLFTQAQYKRFIGSMINMRLHTAIENCRHFKGLLIDVTDNEIVISVADKKITVEWGNIAKANLYLEKQL